MLLVQDEEVERRIAKGEYVNGSRLVKRTKHDGEQYETAEEGIFGICSKCAANDRAITDVNAAAEAQSRRIREHVDSIRQGRKELGLSWTETDREEAVTSAVIREFDPRNEPNPAFRAYLLEHAAKDEASDAAARGFLADLDGPSVAGAA